MRDFCIFLRDLIKVSFNSPNPVMLNFYIDSNVQLKFHIVSNNNDNFVYAVFENIEEKIFMGGLSDRLSFISEFICTLSHELLTPLNQLIQRSDKLKKELNGNDYPVAKEDIYAIQPQAAVEKVEQIDLKELEERRSYSYSGPIDRYKSIAKLQTIGKSNLIVDEIDKLSDLGFCMTYFVQNSLDLARYIHNNLRLNCSEFDMQVELEPLLRIFKKKAVEKGLSFELSIPKLQLFTDQTKLLGVLFIFLENSIKFTNKGRITVKVIKGSSPSMVKFEISDTGIGMDEEEVGKIVKILKNVYQNVKFMNAAGIGIGMRIAQILITLLSGEDLNFDIESQQHWGTTIRFEILKNAHYVGPSSKPKKLLVQKTIKIQDEEIGKAEIPVKPVDLLNERTLNERTLGEKTLGEKTLGERTLMDRNLKKSHSMRSQSEKNKKSRYFKYTETENLTEGEGSKIPCTDDIDSKDEPRISVLNPNIEPHLLPKQYLPDTKKVIKKTMVKLRTMKNKRFDGGNGQRNDNYKNTENSLQSKGNSVSKKALIAELKDINNIKIPGRKKKPLALIVDDDHYNAELLEENLITLGFDTIIAYNGQLAIEACTHLLTSNTPLTVIYMDYSMPGMNGDKCTATLRTPRFDPILKHCKIIGLTAHTDEEVRTKCLQAGMDLVDFKPYNFIKAKKTLTMLKIL